MAEFLADNRIYAEWKAQSLPSLGREQITTILTALRTAQGRLQLHNPAQRRVQGRRNKTSSLDGRKEVNAPILAAVLGRCHSSRLFSQPRLNGRR
jgi:hypothetical protein